MGKAPKAQTVTQTSALDPTTQQYANQVWQSALGAAGTPAAGINQWTTQAAQGYQGMAGAGATGAAALGGDPNAINSFMNPYNQNVINGVQQQYGKLATQTQNSVNDAATRAGAFGGTRQGVATGVALGNLGTSAGQTIAGLQAQGYDGAMNRAAMAANLGLGANGALAGLGQYATQYADQNSPAARSYNYLSGAMGVIPHGSTSTTSTPVNQNKGASFLGGAATGAGIGATFGPWGAGIGAGLGGLMSLF